jgi:putative SOS response-associated peptidase YedK
MSPPLPSTEKRERKIRIARADGQIMSLAGLYEYWRKGDEMIASYTILTTQPNAMMEPIHDRMPVIIADDEVDAWRDADTSLVDVRALCMPCPANGSRPIPHRPEQACQHFASKRCRTAFPMPS